MCDFHSVIVDGAGRIYHTPNNSHSTIAAYYNLADGLVAKWWECEWSGRGGVNAVPTPERLVQLRGKSTTPTSAAYDAAYKHYSKLAEILAVDADENTVFPAPFDQPEYQDVRDAAMAAVIERERRAADARAETIRRAAIAEAEAEADAIAEKLDSTFIGFTTTQEIAFLRRLMESSSLTVAIEDVAEEEIKSAVESATEDMISTEDAYSYVLDGGDYIQTDNVRQYAKEHCDLIDEDDADEYVRKNSSIEDVFPDELQEKIDEAFKEGFEHCRTGSDPKAKFINGMPAFLFNKD